MQKRSIWIGWDPREADAWWVAQHSLLRHLSEPIPVHKLSLTDLQDRGLYTRPTSRRNGRLIDELSIREDYDGSISTEHANARFFVPLIAGGGWALFCDGDVLFRADVAQVFRGLDERKAVYCVKHWFEPTETEKMDGQLQTRYPRKNWSSFVIWNCDHPKNEQLRNIVNYYPGRDLHAFCWLEPDDIGALPRKWNHLVGWSDPQIDPAMVHFTSGTPDMPGYSNCDYADEWRAELTRQMAPAAE
jgi:hypothetical protein